MEVLGALMWGQLRKGQRMGMGQLVRLWLVAAVMLSA